MYDEPQNLSMVAETPAPYGDEENTWLIEIQVFMSIKDIINDRVIADTKVIKLLDDYFVKITIRCIVFVNCYSASEYNYG